MRNLTIFVEERDDAGNINGIYIKEEIRENENKIIITNKGKLLQNKNGFSFNLNDGKITNIDDK